MSHNRSNQEFDWRVPVAIISSIVGGIAFILDKKTYWPELDSPVLRCLVAPVAGVFLSLVYTFWMWPLDALSEIIGSFLRWLTSPRVVLSICTWGLLGGATALLLRWVSPPLDPYWASLGGVVTGTIGGFFALRLGLARVVRIKNWSERALVTFPVSVSLAYWTTTKLSADFELVWVALAIAASGALLVRVISEKE